jgi:hypothetical protein
VYDVDETIWPPLWLKAQGLKAGDTYKDVDQHFQITVTQHEFGGGFRVQIAPLPEPQRCSQIRREVAGARAEIRALQAELHQPGADKPRIVAEIRELQRQIATLLAEAASLSCHL